MKHHWNLRKRRLLGLLLLGLLQTGLADIGETQPLAAGCDGSLWPYRASYDVYRNGKLIGISTSELSREANGQWWYRVSTEATKGLGGLLGGKIHESSRFTLEAGVLRPEHYDLLQKVAFSKVKRSADFDWTENVVHGKNKRKKWQAALVGDESDRLSASIKIRLQLAAGTTPLSCKTVEKGEITVREFEAREAETVITGLGEMLAIPVHRIHSNPKRTTVTWHALQLGYLPVRVEHAKQGGDSGELILTAYQQSDCSVPTAGQVTE